MGIITGCVWGGGVGGFKNMIAKSVYFEEKGDNSPLRELEFDDIGGWVADCELGGYLPNHILSPEFRDAGRSGDCDVSETFSKMNITRGGNGERIEISNDSTRG